MNRQKSRSPRRRVVAALTGAVLAAAGLAVAAPAFAVGGSAADPAYGFVVKVNVGGNRGCTGTLVAREFVVTSRECFQIGSSAPVAGPPPAASTATPRSNSGASAAAVAIDYIVPRDDRNLVLAHLSGDGGGGSANLTATAPAAGETLRVLGYGRTATEWVPDQPHTALLAVQSVSATEAGVTPGGDASICKGDAGGPVVRANSDGTSSLVAVVSTSWQGGCLTETDTRRGAIVTRVDDLGAWISQSTVTTLTGAVQAGSDSGCLVLQAGSQTYNVTGGDASVVKAGATVHVTGFPAPSQTSSCTQGTRFRVTKAVPVTSVTGTVQAGVERGCLVMGQYLLAGSSTGVTAGATVTLTGYQDNSIVSTCQQGTPFVVLTATAPAVISLRAHANNQLVTAESAGASALVANRTAIGVWEQFDLFNNPDGSISLRAHANNQFVTAESAGASPLIANRTVIGVWEEFDLLPNGDGSISLRAHANNQFVTAESAGASPLIANRTVVGVWEEFDLITG